MNCMGTTDTLEKPCADIPDFRSEVCCGGKHRCSPESQQMAKEISERGCKSTAASRSSRADLLPRSGKLKQCHKEWMELDSVANTAILSILNILTEHTWNAGCLCIRAGLGGHMGSESKSWTSMARMLEWGCVQSAGALSCQLALTFTCIKAYRKTQAQVLQVSGLSS